MNWYTATLVYEIDSGSNQLQYDVQQRLIQAPNRSKAYEEAHRLGMLGEEQIKAEKDRIVYWWFAGVAQLYSINLEHGAIVQQTDSLPNGWDKHILQQHIITEQENWITDKAVLRAFNQQPPLLVNQ